MREEVTRTLMKYYIHVNVAMCEALHYYRWRNWYRHSRIIRTLLRYLRAYLRRKGPFILKLVFGAERTSHLAINLLSPLGNLISKPRSILRDGMSPRKEVSRNSSCDFPSLSKLTDYRTWLLLEYRPWYRQFAISSSNRGHQRHVNPWSKSGTLFFVRFIP